ncbi:cytochrome [Marinitenerispora sediminis]|uniref:Cytochrome n=1 Tax=Marinitenerispora sediminis TaxID=1931232 RepID=A0A368T1J2_9ACTN|nr:cytochrome [Marinitenerispora sediminis]RCV53752.1 cytochrome [Marinitenerispora sediminis]RCV54081.1 cytochrome [Marinitenerispora sediminis]
MRDVHGPVVPVELEPGVRAWLVIDYTMITAWCRDTRSFSRDARRWRDWREGRVPDDAGVIPMLAHRPNAMFADGDQHLRLRRAVTDALGGVDGHRVVADVRGFAGRLVDGFAARGRAELLDDYARRLPLLVLTRMLGFGDNAGRRLAAALRGLWDGTDAERANAAYERTLSEAVTAKSAHPGDDVLSRLMAHDAGLSREEVLHHLVLVFGIGDESTANLIGNTVRLLLTDRDLAADLAGTRVSIDDAVDRSLWRDPPMTNFPVLYPVRDIELAGGRTIREGTPVLLGLGAANRFLADEYRERIQETANRAHLAWGVGPHRCPAQDIARLIATTGIETLIDRLPELRLAVAESELRWRNSPFSRGLTALPVLFTPRPPDRLTGYENGAAPATAWDAGSAGPEVHGSAEGEGPGRSGFLDRWLRGR